MQEEMRGWTPTGRFISIEDPRKLWFQFWKPRLRLIEVYRKETEFRCYDANIGYGFSINTRDLSVF